MSVVIGCDSFLSLRNVRNGRFEQHLADERVIVLVDPNQRQGSAEVCPPGIQVDSLLEFDPNADQALSRLVDRAYYTRKSYYDPITLLTKLRASSYRSNPRPGFRRMASLAKAHYTLAKHWMAGRRGLAEQQRQESVQALRGHPVVQEYKRLLDRWQASVVVGLSPEGKREIALLEAANDIGLPTAVMIRSRDNLAAKIQHLPDADLYFVWSESTRDCFRHMYPEIPAERVLVTGSPQFDHHLDPSYRLERKVFFDLVGLDPNRPLIVYTMATPALIDHEIEIAQHLADAANAGEFVRGAQLLVRGHPRMFGSNVRLLHREYPNARAYPRPAAPPYKSATHEAHVVRLILEDEPLHLSVLAYQDVQVNVCGTMTIDSAVLDKPTVNVSYDCIEGVGSGLSVRRFYKRSDIRQMMAYGVSRLARDPQDCVRLINQYLENPTLDADGRARARQGDCGPLDGRAGLRISKAIEHLAWNKAKCIA